MNCKPLFIGHQTIGDRFDDGKVFVFFGNRFFSGRDFSRLFSSWQLSSNQQVHGDQVREVNDRSVIERPNADALVTNLEEVATSVYTADCTPLLAHCSTSGRIGACHAGWRGIENGIVPQFLSQLGSESKSIRVWIGPHIRQKNFEVHRDVADRLRKAPGSREAFFVPHENDSAKERVDLTQIALAQIQACGVQKDSVWVHSEDTYSNQDYFSFRRQGPTGRLISFIVKQSDAFRLR